MLYEKFGKCNFSGCRAKAHMVNLDYCYSCKKILKDREAHQHIFNSLKKIVVGGNFSTGRSSRIISLLHKDLSENTDVLNGGSLEDLKMSLIDYDFIIWAPDISNNEEKFYPKKKPGCVLICTKVMREGYSTMDSVSRIFKMNGNAVIEIYKEKPKMRFVLKDALANVWCDTTDIHTLNSKIRELTIWTRDSIRVSSVIDSEINNVLLQETSLPRLSYLTRLVAQKVEKENLGRYFGNVSTRCKLMFPSTRAFVSARNIDKEYISENDFIFVCLKEDKISYDNIKKPSVDTPIHLKIYESFDKINFMIHGHAFVKDAPFTKEYFPCGDLREFFDLKEIMVNGNGVANLKNHGFLIYAESLEQLQILIEDVKFESRL